MKFQQHPGGGNAKRVRRSRLSLKDRFIGDREAQWRTAGGLILLSGILSLVVSFNGFDGEAQVAHIAAEGSTVTPGMIRRNMMDQPENSVRTADGPIGMTIGSQPTPVPDPNGQPGPFGRKQDEPRGVTEPSPRLWPSAVVDNIESLIQRYPWPTLILGIGVGYLLARRVR